MTFGWNLGFTPKAMQFWEAMSNYQGDCSREIQCWSSILNSREGPPTLSHLYSQHRRWISWQNERGKGPWIPAFFSCQQLDNCLVHSRSPWRQSHRRLPSSFFVGPWNKPEEELSWSHATGHVEEGKASQWLRQRWGERVGQNKDLMRQQFQLGGI